MKKACSFKTYDVTTWETNIAIHIMSNISISKYNQTMKYSCLNSSLGYDQGKYLKPEQNICES